MGVAPLVAGGSVPAAAAPPGDDAIVAFVVRGVGNGHGRGLSQWGSYGRALAGQSWTQILDTYYAGTSLGDRPGAQIRVRLTGWNGSATVGVLSQGSSAAWNGGNHVGSGGHRALYAQETAPNVFDVYASANYLCPGAAALVVPTQPLGLNASGTAVTQLQQVLTHLGHAPGSIDGQYGTQTEAGVKRFQAAEGLTQNGAWNQAEWEAAQARIGPSNPAGWTLIAGSVSGPIRFSSGVDESSAAPGAVLGVCTTSGPIKHYRGVVELTHQASSNYVVNELAVENYLRGVIPVEVPAGWGDGGGGAGMHALRAQSVAARSYAISQQRYNESDTCDTSSCQVYQGADKEDPRTNAAIADTSGKVRVWPDGRVVSTEFSASNGPSTAGGDFPVVDDVQYDDLPGNPLHVWTRVIDADTMATTFGLTSAAGVRTEPAPGSRFNGVWGNRVALGGGRTVDALGFRSAFGLPSHGFELVPITRTTTSATTFAYIGDSVGEGISGKTGEAGPLPALLEGVHATQFWNSRGGRPAGGSGIDNGATVAASVPPGTDLAVVELGYNDSPSQMPGRIDAVMQALRSRGVGQVLWVTVSERRASYDYAATNAAIRAAAERWPELAVIDWKGASEHVGAARWYSSDGVHLTTTGNAEFSLWLREHILHATARPVAAGSVYRVPVLGLAGLPPGSSAGAAGLAGVALNVTAVNPRSPGWLRVWDCAAPEPDTSSVNYMTAGGVEPNAVVVPLATTSTEVCIRTKESTHVIVDVAGWFPADSGGAGILQPAAGRLIDTRDAALAAVPAQGIMRVQVLGQVGVPAVGVAGVALNVTAVEPVSAGWLRVWDCAAPEPDTSSVNYMRPGVVEPNAVVVPLGPGSTGEVCVRSLVESDVLVDVAGWFSAGTQAAAGRVLDTRPTAPLDTGEILRVPMLGAAGVPAAGVAGVALNVTAVEPDAAGWLRVWDCAAPEPDTSSVNYLAGATEPNAVIIPFSADSTGEVCVKTKARTDVLVDVAGWFDTGVAPAAGRIADTRYGIGPLPQ